jgi:hypothetical protein
VALALVGGAVLAAGAWTLLEIRGRDPAPRLAERAMVGLAETSAAALATLGRATPTISATMAPVKKSVEAKPRPPRSEARTKRAEPTRYHDALRDPF